MIKIKRGLDLPLTGAPVQQLGGVCSVRSVAVPTSAPLAPSHTCRPPSRLPDTMRRPSGLNASAVIASSFSIRRSSLLPRTNSACSAPSAAADASGKRPAASRWAASMSSMPRVAPPGRTPVAVENPGYIAGRGAPVPASPEPVEAAPIEALVTEPAAPVQVAAPIPVAAASAPRLR